MSKKEDHKNNLFDFYSILKFGIFILYGMTFLLLIKFIYIPCSEKGCHGITDYGHSFDALVVLISVFTCIITIFVFVSLFINNKNIEKSQDELMKYLEKEKNSLISFVSQNRNELNQLIDKSKHEIKEFKKNI